MPINAFPHHHANVAHNIGANYIVLPSQKAEAFNLESLLFAFCLLLTTEALFHQGEKVEGPQAESLILFLQGGCFQFGKRKGDWQREECITHRKSM